MFRTSKTCLILKNVIGGNFTYKYPFENLIFINSNPQFGKSNFPELKTLLLFNSNDQLNLTLNPSLKMLLNTKIILGDLTNTNLVIPNIRFFTPDNSEKYKQIFLSGCFNPMKDLPKYSTNKTIQDQINYYLE